MGNAPSIPPPAPAPAPTVYNVYNQPVDESNNMPLVPNQLPWPGQQRLLSTERVASSIPKGGGGQWVFPSPQMFFNALQRKGKGGDVTEEDMDSVILTHNTMNELTWRQVLLWERLQKADGGGASEPALVRFLGRPDDLSPRARFRSLLGGPAPFDRHDWYVDRGGKEVRYVIEFYFDESRAAEGAAAFHLDVRPGLDDFSSFAQRARMGVYVWCARQGLPCPFSGSPPLQPAGSAS